MTHYVASQLRKFLKYTTRATKEDKMKRKVKKIHGNLLKFSVLQETKGRIESVMQYLESSADIVLEGQRIISELVRRQKPADFFGCQPICFIEKFGPKIDSLEKSCRANHKILQHLETGLHLYFDRHDPLLSEVQSLRQRSKDFYKTVLGSADQFSRYNSRANVELLWISDFPKTLEMCSEHLAISTQTIIDLQEALLEKSLVMDDLACCKDASQDFGLQFSNLHTLLRTLEATELMSRSSSAVKQAVADLSSHCKNLANIYQEKEIIALRFTRSEKYLKEKIPELERLLEEFHLEVDKANQLYKEKFSHLPMDVLLPDKESHVYKIAGPFDISWRVRVFNNWNISPVIRTQGRGQCAYVSTVSCTESQLKKKHAAHAGSKRNETDEFTLKLSHDQLQDLVTTFCEKNSRRGCNTLDYCLEVMEEQGIVTEEAYGAAKENSEGIVKEEAQGIITEEAYAGAKDNFESFQRYRIKGFKKLSESNVEGAKEIIMDGTALIGNFRITTGYSRLGPDDIYDIPEDAVFETTITGKVWSHCVVILGYGMTSEGLAYYIFQNSYGPSWGKDGFGRVACSCLSHLYCPRV